MYCSLWSQSDAMCSASRAKRTSLPKETSRTKCASRSAQAEHIVPKTKALLTKCFCFWRRHPDLNRGIEVLQTFALPLGHVALCLSDVSDYIIIFPFQEYCYKKQGASLRPSFWSGLRGSNPPPSPWQGDALPNELSPRVVPPVGIEPTTRGFSVLCSTN